jgi:ABC-2 type transport system permease protein
MNFIAVFVFAIANGVLPKLSWLEMIPIVGAYVVLATGVGMLLSALFVQYRDVQPIWEVLSQVIFYLTPILYTVLFLRSAGLEHVGILNPLAMLNTQMAHAVIGSTPLTGASAASYGPDAFPSAATVAGGYAHLLAPIAILIGLFCLGWWVFIREAPRVAEHL